MSAEMGSKEVAILTENFVIPDKAFLSQCLRRLWAPCVCPAPSGEPASELNNPICHRQKSLILTTMFAENKTVSEEWASHSRY